MTHQPRIGVPVNQVDEQVARTVRIFRWEAVDAPLTRALLTAAYGASGQQSEIPKVKKLDGERLAEHAAKALGRPLAAKHLETKAVVEVLRSKWIPTLSNDALDDLIWSIQLSLYEPERSATPNTKAQRLKFLRQRNNTKNFRKNLRSAFLRAHKVPQPAQSKPGSKGGGHVAFRELVGLDETPITPYPHQREAWANLDRLLTRQADDRAGLLVLPTGSGKSFTAVHWLLKQLQADPHLRVLWVADQQELVEQAAREFERDAATMPDDFVRRLRVIHSGASPKSALADPDLDVACVTRQSLIAGKSADLLRGLLESFLSRPTIVVIDEAHHAVARTYQDVLGVIRDMDATTVRIGLTATPWPSGQGMVALLESTFPEHLISVDTMQLMRDGILAQPIVHTVVTDEQIELEEGELEILRRGDFSASILRRLDTERRNTLVVDTWTYRKDQWGKTLVFVGSIAHADHLAEAFLGAGVECLVLHSESELHRIHVLHEFREAAGPIVLVSVGMLLEGVDIPDARTAFLARPTLSRILMRQMIGRVLRGPAAGGDECAHVVALEDHWLDGIDVLSPVDIREVPPPEVVVDGEGQGAHRLPAVPDEISGEPIPENILRRVERAYAEVVHNRLFTVESATLIGYYQLSDVNVPVFEHTLDAWNELIEAKLDGSKLPVKSILDLFGDLAAPRPTRRDVDAVVTEVLATGKWPTLVEIKSVFSMHAAARRLLNAPAMTEKARIDWLRKEYESTLARTAFPSFHAFSEALGQHVLMSSGAIRSVANPEAPRAAVPEPGLPRLHRKTSREIEPLLKTAAAKGRELLWDAGEHDYADWLTPSNLPPVRWTRRPVRSTFAVWVPNIGGKSRGAPVVRVNRLLQAPKTQVPDDLLEYLLWHELCHHLLPAHGHDAEFYRLLTMWPEFARLDHELDSLHERYDLGWTSTAD
ncbi:hypothetical protein AAT18_12815 [Rhodococcus aetherivorans]|nr:hypothetical protein AAT18_12815 [Rhodococcus aetherivorans]